MLEFIAGSAGRTNEPASPCPWRTSIQWYNGSRWVTEATYTSTDMPDLLSDNSSSHSGTVDYTPTRSGSYRAIVTFIAKDSGGTSRKQTTANLT